MKSIEPSTNNGVKKPPPYSVQDAPMISDPPAPDPHTADLVSAVQYDYYDRLIELIEPNPNLVVTPDNNNITLLHWAAINNRVEIAKYLINKGADIDAYGGELNSTPLHWAIRDGKLQMVIFLLSHQAQSSLFDGEGFSSIHLASMFGHTDIVAYLIAKGEDVDSPDKHGMTPLIHAVSKVKNRDPTQLLIRLGTQINYQNSDDKNNTPLHYAITTVNREAVSLLIDAGAKTDIHNSNNESPYDLVERWPVYRHFHHLLAPHRFSNNDLPKWLQLNNSNRRLGTILLPFLIILLVACIFQVNFALIYKGVLLISLILITKGYIMIFFDNNVDRYLPTAIALASLFWLYTCYFYYFIQYVHVISFNFLGLIICTYLSWTNYYLAQKRDPGVIVTNRDQQYRTIIQLAEQNLFDNENFCTCCLIRRPLRSKHCRECHKCISKFDHHCPWIDNCVGEKNIRYFIGFLFFTPLCVVFYFHGAYLYYRYHCHLFSTEIITQSLLQAFNCSPAILWFTAIAVLHTVWIGGLCIATLFQIATGYTTNEKMNSWRYKYLKSKAYSPFSLGWIQNLVDLVNRRILWYTPINLDWTRIYTIEDFYQAIPLRLRQKLNLSSVSSSMGLTNV